MDIQIISKSVQLYSALLSVAFAHKRQLLSCFQSITSSSNHTATFVQAAAKAVERAYPAGIDYLINNAGILGTYSCIADQ